MQASAHWAQGPGKVCAVARGNHLSSALRAEGRGRAAYSTAWVVKGNSDLRSVDSLCRPWPPLTAQVEQLANGGGHVSLQKLVVLRYFLAFDLHGL